MLKKGWRGSLIYSDRDLESEGQAEAGSGNGKGLRLKCLLMFGFEQLAQASWGSCFLLYITEMIATVLRLLNNSQLEGAVMGQKGTERGTADSPWEL